LQGCGGKSKETSSKPSAVPATQFDKSKLYLDKSKLYFDKSELYVDTPPTTAVSGGKVQPTETDEQTEIKNTKYIDLGQGGSRKIDREINGDTEAPEGDTSSLGICTHSNCS
jgi:hypothetical protein